MFSKLRERIWKKLRSIVLGWNLTTMQVLDCYVRRSWLSMMTTLQLLICNSLKLRSCFLRNKRVQEELQKVKIELRKEEEQQSRAKVAEIRDGLKKARSQRADVLPLLRQLSETRCSWETVMETRIGVELKNCQDCGEGAKQLCQEILARMKDESKEQRPMWESWAVVGQNSVATSYAVRTKRKSEKDWWFQTILAWKRTLNL